MGSLCPKFKNPVGQIPLDLKTRFREKKDFKGLLNSLHTNHWQNLDLREEKEMDIHNNFQMPSKQYLTESSEHQLES